MFDGRSSINDTRRETTSLFSLSPLFQRARACPHENPLISGGARNITFIARPPPGELAGSPVASLKVHGVLDLYTLLLLGKKLRSITCVVQAAPATPGYPAWHALAVTIPEHQQQLDRPLYPKVRSLPAGCDLLPQVPSADMRQRLMPAIDSWRSPW